MARPSALLFSLLLALVTLTVALPSPAPRTNHTLARRTGLVPHVGGTAFDIFPGGGGAYPRVTGLADGSLLGSVTASSGSTRILTVTRSTDGGQTWSAWGEIARGTGDLDNLYLLQLANGDVVAAYRNHDLVNGAATFYRISTSVSHDNGKTWAFLSQVDERAATTTKNGLWEPFMRLSKADGSLQVYYAAENSGADQDILMKSSTDNGQSWGAVTTVAGATTTGRDGMPGCANFNDGTQKLMCVFETTEGRTGGTFNVKSVVSIDEGKTWGQRSLVWSPKGDAASNAGAPQIVATTDGNLVVSFMTDEDVTQHNWPNAGVSFKIVTGPPVATGNWGHETTITGAQSDWPGLFAKSDGSVLACSGHTGEGAVCRLVTFTPN